MADHVAIVCVRLGSSRLQGKALRTAAGVTLLDHILNRVRFRMETVLAVPPAEAEVFRPYATDGVGLYFGQTDSPLHRLAGVMAGGTWKWAHCLRAARWQVSDT